DRVYTSRRSVGKQYDPVTNTRTQISRQPFTDNNTLTVIGRKVATGGNLQGIAKRRLFLRTDTVPNKGKRRFAMADQATKGKSGSDHFNVMLFVYCLQFRHSMGEQERIGISFSRRLVARSADLKMPQ